MIFGYTYFNSYTKFTLVLAAIITQIQDQSLALYIKEGVDYCKIEILLN